MDLCVLHYDGDLIAIDKPAGLLVHPTQAAAREQDSCLKILRDQVGAHLYPVHRLDRATSGVLLFAFTPEGAAMISEQFVKHQVIKKYSAVVRGHPPEEGAIEKPLKKLTLSRKRNERMKNDPPLLEARTRFKRLAVAELPFAVSRYPSARYSLVEVTPETGRLHQIRRHFGSISHPIVGDSKYGDGKHNLFFRNELGIRRLMLTARSIELNHPVTGKPIRIEAPWPAEFAQVFERMGWSDLIKRTL